MATPIFLIAHPRSGTHLLRGYLSGGEQIEDFGEVFNPRMMRDSPAGFFAFLTDRVRADPSAAVPHQAGRAEMFDDYVAHLSSLARCPYMLVDVKYDTTHHLNGIWRDVDEVPALIEMIKARGYPTIHLVRRNLLEQHCSFMLALATDRWGVTRRPADTDDQRWRGTIRIDTESLVETLGRMHTRVSFFTWCVREHVPLAQLAYEDLIEDGRMSDLAKGAAEYLLREPFDVSREPATAKLSPPLRDYVENYDEVIRVLAGTPFITMVT